MKSSLTKRTLLVVSLFSLVLFGFVAGGIAHKKCMFPFCRGYYVQTAEVVNEVLTDEPDVDGGDGDVIQAVGTDTIKTNLYELIAQKYQHGARPRTAGIRQEYIKGRDGGIDNLGEGLVVATGTGALFLLDEAFNIQRMTTAIPLNRDAFVRDTQEMTGFSNNWFGVKDILMVEDVSDTDTPDTVHLFASHHHWDADAGCHTLRVSQATFRRQEITTEQAEWKTVFETYPCLEVDENLKHPFAGHEAGGRMVQLSDDALLLSVGYQGHDGVSGRNLPQDSSNAYGKMIRINLEEGTSALYSLGHRNPQGLHVDSQGRIWSTEHGPKGGDELNLIREGVNYGWPNVSYGTDYGSYAWPLSNEQGRHAGFTAPVYAWVPSIGVSQMISVQNNLFERWQGDLIVSSLKAKKLFRLRVREGRVVFAEPIHIGMRIRDLVEMRSGAIVLKTDTGTFVRLIPSPDVHAEDRRVANEQMDD